jgi:hypothetical protein
MKPDGILRSSVFRPPSSTLRRTLPLCPLGDAIPCICFCSHEAPSRNMLPVDAKWAAHLEMLYLGAYYCLLFCFPFWMAASGTSPMNHRGKASPSNRFVKCRLYPHILSFSSMSNVSTPLCMVCCELSLSRTSSLLIQAGCVLGFRLTIHSLYLQWRCREAPVE